MRLRSLSTFVPIGLALVAFACGASEGKEEGGVHLAVIPKGTTHEFWKTVHAGARTAAREAGVEMTWKGPLREDDRDGQVKVVEDFIIKGVDGIVLMPLDDQALVPVAQEAADQGIPVIIADSDLRWDGRVSYVATDNYEGGRTGGEHLAQLLGGEGKVVVMRYVEGSASTMRREQGCIDLLTENYPGIEIVSDNQYSGATVEGAYQTSENLLQSHGEIDGIFASNESSAFGMLRALEDAGRAGSVKFVGFDASEKLLAGLEEGVIDALVVQDPFAMGRLSVERMLDHLAGRPVDPRIDTGCKVVTAANLAEPEIAALVSPDLSILDE